MEVKVNHISFEVPFDLTQIPLGKFIEYHEQYGQELDEALTAILEKKYEGDEDTIELDRSIDIDNHIDNEGLAWFSFWTGFDMFEAKDHPEMILLLQQYRVLRNLLDKSMQDAYDFPLFIDWQGEQWQISDFKINPVSNMSFNEIITSKEIMRQIYKVGKGKWNGLPYLCAVFLRKKGEEFSDELIHEEGERMQLFKDLPLNHAMQVAFFLSICVSSWQKTLVYSKRAEERTNLN